MILADPQLADATTLLTTDRPALTEAHAAQLLREHYGLEGELETQDSERDQNFLLRPASGQACVLKIANSAEAEAITDFQIAALLHLENSAIAARIPKVVRTIDGSTRIHVSAQDGRTHTARVLSWLPGDVLRPESLGANSPCRMGELIAALGAALLDFEHPASDYPLLWDIKRASGLRELLDTVADPALRAVLAAHLDTFVSEVELRLSELRWQVIHNDLNPGNVCLLYTSDAADDN